MKRNRTEPKREPTPRLLTALLTEKGRLTMDAEKHNRIKAQGYSSVGRASVSKTAPYSRDFNAIGTLSYQDKRKTGHEPVNRNLCANGDMQ